MPEIIDVVEALLFASDTPVEASRIQEVLDLESPAVARELVENLRGRLDAEGRALQVMEVGGGFRLVTRPEVAPWLVKLARSRTRSRLSRPSLETLAIIGYRQPVSRPEVDAIRGVNSDAVLLVVRAGHTAVSAAAEAMRHLLAVGARVTGVVLNDPDERAREYGGYYGYGYRTTRT